MMRNLARIRLVLVHGFFFFFFFFRTKVCLKHNLSIPMASEWKNGMLDELHKLSAIESEETLNHMVCTLCSTRKTGLPLSDKSHFQSLLQLSSLSQLDTVLACLRYLLRKCAHHNLSRHDILKLFPPHLPLHLQTNLLSSLHKNKDRWKEYVSVSPPQLAARDGASSLLWPPREQQQQQEALHQFNRADLEPAPTEVAPCFRCDAVAASENLVGTPTESDSVHAIFHRFT